MDNELAFFRYSNDVDHTLIAFDKAKGRPAENANSATLTSDHAFPADVDVANLPFDVIPNKTSLSLMLVR